jgi:hypothetical protein
MDIITNSVRIKGTSDPAGAIIAALCNHGTDEEPRTPTDAEKWSAIKRVRNELLALCDWAQVNDAPLTIEQKTAWADYRQALRDIPQDYDTPESVIFPEAPNG